MNRYSIGQTLKYHWIPGNTIRTGRIVQIVLAELSKDINKSLILYKLEDSEISCRTVIKNQKELEEINE